MVKHAIPIILVPFKEYQVNRYIMLSMTKSNWKFHKKYKHKNCCQLTEWLEKALGISGLLCQSTTTLFMSSIEGLDGTRSSKGGRYSATGPVNKEEGRKGTREGGRGRKRGRER